MISAADGQRELQQGIYLRPSRRPPNSFLFLVLDIAPRVAAADARRAVAAVWKLLLVLQRGSVRELTATREGEGDAGIEPGTFDALLGYGASFFDTERALTAGPKPDLLAPLGHPGAPFASLTWGPGVRARSGEGDLCLQLTGRDEHAVNRAAVELWKLIVDEDLPLLVREAYDGFARDDGRSWIGFHDGVSNIRPSQRLAAVECTDPPDWNRGGTYLAYLRCQVDLMKWRELTREEQEVLVGRDKLTGCALEKVEIVNGGLVLRPFAGCPAMLGATPEQRDLFRDPPETGDPLVEASHIHRANQNRAEPTTSAGHRIFRQGYEYLEALDSGGPRLGLNFISFQRDLEHLRQILGLPGWLGGVNFGGRPGSEVPEPPAIDFISLRAGGFYAVPPRRQPFPGAVLFAEE